MRVATVDEPLRSSAGAATQPSAPLAARPERRFTLLDAMIIIAATAVGLGAVRSELGKVQSLASLRHLTFTLNLVSPVLGVWTLSLLVLRARGPRPKLRQMARQPGVAACLAATLVLAGVGTLLLSERLPAPGFTFAAWDEVWWRMSEWPAPISFASVGIALAILASWLILWLSGRRRRTRSWIDRTGRCLGVAWLAMAACVCAEIVHDERSSMKMMISSTPRPMYSTSVAPAAPAPPGTLAVPITPADLPPPLP